MWQLRLSGVIQEENMERGFLQLRSYLVKSEETALLQKKNLKYELK